MPEASNSIFLIYIAVLTCICIGLVAILIYGYFRYKKLSESKVATDNTYRNLTLQFTDLHLNQVHAQLNPHLLKNVLNSILSHTYQTYYTMEKLANVLDYVLYESPNKMVSPKEEIDFALNLIEINKIKVSPLFDIKVKVNVNPADERLYTEKVLAPLISIDLIENAFKHADLQNPDSFIAILISFKNGILSIHVSNKVSDKSPLKKEKSGVGQRTLEERLQVLYKDRYTLQKIVDNNTYISHLTIDLNDSKSKMHTP